MSTEPIFMEQSEYEEYLKNAIQHDPNEPVTPIAQVTMYQMNKDLVRTLKSMSNMEVNAALDKVKQWYEDYMKDNDDLCYHFALLNHEKHYFTIFQKDPIDGDRNSDSFIRELKDILTNYYGDKDLRAIDVLDGVVEIWAMWDGEPTVAYLFPYEEGVVDY